MTSQPLAARGAAANAAIRCSLTSTTGPAPNAPCAMTAPASAAPAPEPQPPLTIWHIGCRDFPRGLSAAGYRDGGHVFIVVSSSLSRAERRAAVALLKARLGRVS
jgi:hypothetical protein